MELKNFSLSHHRDLSYWANLNTSRPLECSTQKLSWREETSTSFKLKKISPSKDESRDPCNLEILLIQWLSSLEDISWYKGRKIKENGKIKRNSKKIPLPKNGMKVKEERIYWKEANLTKVLKCPREELFNEEAMEKTRKWKEYQPGSKQYLEKPSTLRSLGLSFSSLGLSLFMLVCLQ